MATFPTIRDVAARLSGAVTQSARSLGQSVLSPEFDAVAARAATIERAASALIKTDCAVFGVPKESAWSRLFGAKVTDPDGKETRVVNRRDGDISFNEAQSVAPSLRATAMAIWNIAEQEDTERELSAGTSHFTGAPFVLGNQS